LMIVIDEYSKFKIVRLLKAKSDVVDAMAELFDALEIKVGRHVAMCRRCARIGGENLTTRPSTSC
jgi:hypothetical protein